MGSVLLHSGMPKTGSTSIQTWLFEQRDLLAANGVHVVLDRAAPDGSSYRIGPVGDAPIVNANVFLLRYAGARQRREGRDSLAALSAEFTAALDAAVAELGDVVISSEGFASLFQRSDEPFLEALDGLAARHEVTVAHYVRPQDTALEARWRQWGFAGRDAPSAWVVSESDALRYGESYTAVTTRMSRFAFDVRPFRSDLLAGGSAVQDFAAHFLGIDDPPPIARMNPGLSIDLANLLHLSPPELLARPARTNGTGWRQGELAGISARWDVAVSDAAKDARAVLGQYARNEFEASNRTLATALGWPVEDFVVPPADERWVGAGTGELLAALDRLWTPDADATVLGYLFAALGELWSDRRRA